MILPLAELRGSAFSTCWLSQQLSTLAIDADEVTLERSACGFILALLGPFYLQTRRVSMSTFFLFHHYEILAYIYLQLG